MYVEGRVCMTINPTYVCGRWIVCNSILTSSYAVLWMVNVAQRTSSSPVNRDVIDAVEAHSCVDTSSEIH